VVTSISINDEIAHYASKYSVNPVIASKIIGCESGFDPHATNINKNGTKDYSWWQINDIHKHEALEHGFDITNPEDNLEYGFIMYHTYGNRIWNASRHCWDT